MYLATRQATVTYPTYRKHKTFAKQLQTFADSVGYVMVDQFRPADIDAFYTKSKLSPRSKAKMLERLRGFFRFAVHREWIPKSPVSPDLRPPAGSTRVANKMPFTDQEKGAEVDAGCARSVSRRAGCDVAFVGYNSPATPQRGRKFLRTRLVFGVLVVVAALAAPAKTAEIIPDPSTDREFSAKLAVCNECHGVDGVRRIATIPVIWGQHENYLVKQLHDFESGDRNDEVMSWMTKTLTQEELRAAAAYFAKQTWPARSTDAASPPPPPGIAGCQACHAKDFLGARQTERIATPRLAGLSYEYLVEAMRRFAEGERKNDAAMMKMMAAIPPADREAIARYLSGL